jgi:hypothetical protein
VLRMIAGLILSGFVLVLSGCATKKFYHGVEATDLSGLFIGINRPDVEKITGSATKVFECDSGTIATYLYDCSGQVFPYISIGGFTASAAAGLRYPL